MIGAVRRRFWTEAECQVVRDGHGKQTAAELAAVLGRTEPMVHRARYRLGLNRRIAPRGQPLVDYLRAQHAIGWSDTEIAAGWTARHPDCAPVERHGIGTLRASLGLPDNTLSEHRRRRVAARTAEQLARAGLPSIGHLRVEAFKKRAREAGWPDDLRPRAVQMLNVLWDRGPMTRRELADAIGMPWKGSQKSLANQTNYAAPKSGKIVEPSRYAINSKREPTPAEIEATKASIVDAARPARPEPDRIANGNGVHRADGSRIRQDFP